MNKRNLKTRFVKIIGHELQLVVMKDGCSNAYAKNHYARITVEKYGIDPPEFDKTSIDEESYRGTVCKCEHCGEDFVYDDKCETSKTIQSVYDTDTGKPEPGDVYFADWYPDDMYWKDKRDEHVMVVLPNGIEWYVDGRASNCTMPDDVRHRCWVRHGSPENNDITVDKNGVTCSAGAGSIIAGDWHGFLKNGELLEC